MEYQDTPADPADYLPPRTFCPECRAGKHINCTTLVLVESNGQDVYVNCECGVADHLA